MKILMLNWRCPTNPKSGGAEYVTHKHLEAWALACHEVHWLAGGYPGAKSYEKLPVSEITKKQCSQLSPPLSTVNSQLSTAPPLSTFDRSLSRASRGDESQVVHLHRSGSPLTIYLLAPLLYWFKWHGDFDLVIDQIHGIPFLTPLWAWRSRKIAFIHEVAQSIWDLMAPWPMNIIGKLYERLYFLLYRHIPFWVDSNSTKDDLVRYGIQPSLIHVIPCAIDLEPVAEVPEKEKTLTFIFLARLVKMKGIEDALRIIAEVKKTNPDVKLWVVGSGDSAYVSHLQNMVNELGVETNVEFKGRVDEEEKVALLRRAHWLLHTSIHEGFGLTVLEANSQGTPVAAYNSQGLNEVISVGINGHLISKSKMNTNDYNCQDMRYHSICISSIEKSSRYSWQSIIATSINLINDFR